MNIRLLLAAVVAAASLMSCTRILPGLSTLENDDAVMRIHLPKAVMAMADNDMLEDFGPQTKISNMDIYVFRNGVSTGIGRKMLSDMKKRDKDLDELLAADSDGEQASICGIAKKGRPDLLRRLVIAAFAEKEGAIVVLNGTIDLEGIELEDSDILDIARSKK